METKICRECKEEKPIEEFTKHKRMKGGYDNICKECNRIHASKWNEENPDKYKLRCKRWYRANKTQEAIKKRKKYEEFVNYVASLKDGKSCIICGYNKEPQILHYHHRNQLLKSFDISDSISNKKLIKENPEILLEEIKKCDLLCPNCHYELHYKERKNKKAL